MTPLPELGVGTIWLAGLDPWIEASGTLVDFLEIEPATMTLADGSVPAVGDNPLHRLANDGRSIVTHCVSAPIGGTIAPRDGFAAIGVAADIVDAPWVSEHLSINRLRHADDSVHATGFFLPPAQTRDSVEIAVANLKRLRQITGRPVAFETGVSYLKPQPGEMSDGAFWRAVAEEADCFIVCDLHNIWCNSANGRQAFDATIDELPLERVCEIHLAGGREHDGYMLDSHAGLVSRDLMAKAAEVIERLPALKAVTFEMMPNSIPLTGVDMASYQAQFESLQRLWKRRGTRAGSPMSGSGGAPVRTSTQHNQWDARSWEAALAASFSHLPGERKHSIDDPGIDIYRHLIRKMRSGTVVSTVQLSYRMLAMSKGLEEANRMLHDYQDRTPPSQWVTDEADGFSEYLRRHASDVPYLIDIVDFEAASREVIITGAPAEVSFGCDPGPLLDALRRGERPSVPAPMTHVVTIEP